MSEKRADGAPSAGSFLWLLHSLAALTRNTRHRYIDI